MKSRSASSAQWMSSNTRTVERRCAEALDEPPPRRERLARRSPNSPAAASSPTSTAEVPLDPLRFVEVLDQARHGLGELRGGRGLQLVGFEDPGLVLDDLAERPERHPAPYGGTDPASQRVSSACPHRRAGTARALERGSYRSPGSPTRVSIYDYRTLPAAPEPTRRPASPGVLSRRSMSRASASVRWRVSLHRRALGSLRPRRHGYRLAPCPWPRPGSHRRNTSIAWRGRTVGHSHRRARRRPAPLPAAAPPRSTTSPDCERSPPSLGLHVERDEGLARRHRGAHVEVELGMAGVPYRERPPGSRAPRTVALGIVLVRHRDAEQRRATASPMYFSTVPPTLLELARERGG